MALDLSLDDYTFQVTESSHVVLDRYSQTHPGPGKNPQTAPFRTMKDVYLMAVYLAVRAERSRPLEGKRAGPFKGSVLTHEEQMFLRAVAMGHSGDPEVMADPQRVVRISEQFANAGIWELDEILTSSHESALWNLADRFAEELAEQ